MSFLGRQLWDGHSNIQTNSKILDLDDYNKNDYDNINQETKVTNLQNKIFLTSIRSEEEEKEEEKKKKSEKEE